MLVLAASFVAALALAQAVAGTDTAKNDVTKDQTAAAPPPTLLVHFNRQREATLALYRDVAADPRDDLAISVPADRMALPFSAGWSLRDTTRRRRPRAIALSDGYYTRLKIHQIGAFAMLPLVAAEFIVGESLIGKEDRPSGLKSAHNVIAGGIGVVFGVNTITGAWNWWETRKDPTGRTRRTLHSLLMLAADAGFLWTASAGGDAKHDLSGARHHRALAEASISLSVLSSVMMWLWKG
ncbi:MAG: hypothetical protein ABI647_26355 [Gemmatimonadota bacterium]